MIKKYINYLLLIFLIFSFLTDCANPAGAKIFIQTNSSAEQAFTVEEYPTVNKSVDSPTHLEFRDYLSGDALTKRLTWRSPPPYKMVQSPNQILEKFGYHLQPDPISSAYVFQLFKGDTLIVDQIYHFWQVTVNSRGDDFEILVAPKMGANKLVQKEQITDMKPSPYNETPPIIYGNDLISAHMEGDKVLVQAENKTLYSINPGRFEVENPLKGLWSWNEHWVLEVHGKVIIDGQDLNKQLGYAEIFNWHLINGEPFFFFRKQNIFSGYYGMYYAGVELPYRYDGIIHYACCEPAAFNPAGNEQMIWFYAQRGKMWYYVEGGMYQ